MDKILDQDKQAKAFRALWKSPAFSGMAIVGQDGTIMTATPQFCELLDVSPAQVVGKRFQDITPPKYKKMDEENAKLLMDGLGDYYFLPKSYDFGDGVEKKVILLVNRVPIAAEGNFEFFLSRIMVDEDGSSPIKDLKNSELRLLSGLSLIQNKKFLAALGTLLAALVIALAEYIRHE